MGGFQANTRDVRFVMWEQIGAAKFLALNLLPEADARHKAILAGDRSALVLPECAF